MQRLLLVFATISWFTVACSGEGSSPSPTHGDCTCLALGVDYQNGVGIASAIALPELRVTRDVVPVSGDPVLRLLDGRIYIVNRFGHDHITIVDPDTFSVIEQFSTGQHTNPQDVAVVGNQIYVALFGDPVVQVWDLPLTRPARQIDFSSFDPDDGNPNIHSLAVVGERLFVSMEVLDPSFMPRGRGRVAVVDTATEMVQKSLELKWSNPFGFLHRRGEDLVVATVADFGGQSGCVERLATDPPFVEECLAANSQLGGYVNSIAVGSDDDLFLAVSPSFDSGKILWIKDSGMQTLSDSMHVATDVGYCAATNQVVYRDGNTGGLFVYDLDEEVVVNAAPLNIGLPAAPQNGIVCF